MGYERNEKIMIEILAEIVQKTNGKTMIDIRMCDPEKLFNLDLLKRIRRVQNGNEEIIFTYSWKKLPSDPSRNIYTTRLIREGITGLSIFGLEYLSDLRSKHERDEREKETLRIAAKSYRISVVAAILSFFAVLTSLLLGYFSGISMP